MRFAPLALAVLAAGCTSPESNQVNQDDSLATAESAADDATGAPSDGQPGEPAQPGGPDPQPAPPAPPGQPAPPAPPPEAEREVTLSASPSRVAAGGTVTLALTNGLRQPIGYNLCTSALIRNGRQVPTDRVCTMELRTLQPGGRATYGYELPSNLASGSYRFNARVDRMNTGSGMVVRSNVVEVTGR